MKLTESALRKIIKEELLKEMNKPSWDEIITDFSSALLPITGVRDPLSGAGSKEPNIQRSIQDIQNLPYIKKAPPGEPPLNNPQIQVDPANSQNVKVFFVMSDGNSYHYNVTGWPSGWAQQPYEGQVVISDGKTNQIIYKNF